MKKAYLIGLVGLVLAMLLAACGGTEGTSSGNGGHTMDMGTATSTHTMDMGTATPNANAPFDAKFIDSMIAHHQGAIDMAKQAQTQAEHNEIKTLANNIVTDQQSEITKMQGWRTQWYPDLGPTTGMEGMHMGDMEISSDTSKPFDLRFISAMISHHEGAIMMANEAKTSAEQSEIKTLADSIITAQTNEINQMKEWKKQWYGENA